MEIQEALDARNYIIHQSINDNIELLLDEVTKNELIKKIKRLRSKISKVINIFHPIISTFNEAEGVDEAAILEEVKAAFY